MFFFFNQIVLATYFNKLNILSKIVLVQCLRHLWLKYLSCGCMWPIFGALKYVITLSAVPILCAFCISVSMFGINWLVLLAKKAHVLLKKICNIHIDNQTEPICWCIIVWCCCHLLSFMCLYICIYLFYWDKPISI